ncbi:hypothetical protein [Francisella tularensis]|uniref:hypothetical protein n=1 Tax=Francisella tularensis TaxID=263 RepID=UPI000185525A|nr:hypothetical protein [Francisella tularensis]EDZ90050.1 lipoprotein, putative [Francisella tularensis subsp. novicida FTG]MBK2108935.1 hypothetical protein [Francisella tularensis subsp. novicida FSC595]MBK2334978.1 hypothetical protein [Francisella tularensis subsp. novicida]
MRKLKHIGVLAFTAFTLASCGVSKDNMIKECVKDGNTAIPGADFDTSNDKNEFYSRTDEEKNQTQAAIGFALLPKNVEYYIVVIGNNLVKDNFFGNMKQARYECAFDKNGNLVKIK